MLIGVVSYGVVVRVIFAWRSVLFLPSDHLKVEVYIFATLIDCLSTLCSDADVKIRMYLRESFRYLLSLCVLAVVPLITNAAMATKSSSLVDFNDPKVQGHLDALVRMAQSCVIKVRATPKDVRAYFTNSQPMTRSGQCFAACMLEQSDVINHGKVNRELLVHLASLVNGKDSRVVRKLKSVSRLCMSSIDGISERCQLASTYNDCLNENMLEFAFPLDIAEEAVRRMPFHLIQPNLPPELRQNS